MLPAQLRGEPGHVPYDVLGRRRFDWRGQLESLRTGRLHGRDEAVGGKPGGDEQRPLADVDDGHPGAGIQIDDAGGGARFHVGCELYGAVDESRVRHGPLRGMELEGGEVREVDERGRLSCDEVLDAALGSQDGLYGQPVRCARRHVLLEERLRVDAVGEPHAGQAATGEMGEHRVGDREVVRDDLRLREVARGVEDLVQVRQRERPLTHGRHDALCGHAVTVDGVSTSARRIRNPPAGKAKGPRHQRGPFVRCDYRAWTRSACGPLGPCVISNSTF